MSTPLSCPCLPSSPQQTCLPRITTSVSLDTPALDLEPFLAAAAATLTDASGGATCPLDTASPTVEVTSSLKVAVRMPAARALAIAGGSSSSAGATGAGSGLSVCSLGPTLLASSMGLSLAEVSVWVRGALKLRELAECALSS